MFQLSADGRKKDKGKGKILTKTRFLLSFLAVTFLLAVLKWTGVAGPPSGKAADADSVVQVTVQAAVPPYHRIRSVGSYLEAFPDTNAVQLVAARQWGVEPVLNRADAEARKKELVYIASSPYYHVAPLHQSIPYLVPRAAVLLHDIGQAFFDSLYIKGLPLQRLIVTSVLRTQEDRLACAGSIAMPRRTPVIFTARRSTSAITATRRWRHPVGGGAVPWAATR